ncbi:glutathione transferase GstA [Solimonas marina]|uniref:Glutathione transferase GstA n=1 Tax=Solimonas marina TaxID=2714601 RepID=A0A970B5U5_9GAMM|nr:glutathione transferase GstA [Solimonas marina]NKF23767.1 glutathione transferase GstA [Solimonas marina]
MKLYYTPGACSLSPHIALREAGMTFELKAVNLKNGTLADGTRFRDINPKGYVPALQLDDGTLLTEGPAIVQYIADQVPDKQLAPAAGTMARYQLQEWLTFIGTELHKTFTPLFAGAGDEAKSTATAQLQRRLPLVEAALKAHPYLLGETYSVADAYLFVVLSWAGYVGFDLSPWPALGEFRARVAARPAVQEALRAEGLLQ